MSKIASATGTNGHVCILLVEPNQELGEALASWLQSRGFQVHRVTSAKEARAALHNAQVSGREYDGLLIDFSVLGFVAYGVMSAFQDQFPRCPVAAMASAGDLFIEFWARVHGVHVLRKPFSLPALSFWCDRIRNASPAPEATMARALQTVSLAGN